MSQLPPKETGTENKSKLMDRIDNWLIKFTTKITVQWIKRNKYKKHKFDFFLTVTAWECAYWVAQFMFTYVRGPHTVWVTVAFVFIVSTIAIMEYLKIRMLQDIKVAYDELWERRKSPAIYQAIKELTEHYCKENHHRKPRQISIIFLGTFVILLSIFAPLVAPVYLFFIFSLYQDCIFDFDPPEKKEKKEKSTVTDLVMNSWKNLIGNLAPAKV